MARETPAIVELLVVPPLLDPVPESYPGTVGERRAGDLAALDAHRLVVGAHVPANSALSVPFQPGRPDSGSVGVEAGHLRPVGEDRHGAVAADPDEDLRPLAARWASSRTRTATCSTSYEAPTSGWLLAHSPTTHCRRCRPRTSRRSTRGSPDPIRKAETNPKRMINLGTFHVVLFDGPSCFNGAGDAVSTTPRPVATTQPRTPKLALPCVLLPTACPDARTTRRLAPQVPFRTDARTVGLPLRAHRGGDRCGDAARDGLAPLHPHLVGRGNREAFSSRALYSIAGHHRAYLGRVLGARASLRHRVRVAARDR